MKALRFITKQFVRGNLLITHSQRAIHERRAVIRIAINGSNELFMYQDGVRYLLDQNEFAKSTLENIMRYVEDVQLGGRPGGWHHTGTTAETTTWESATLLGDSGGNGFNEEELDLIRKSRAPKVNANKHHFESHGQYPLACLHCGKPVENWRHQLT